MKNRLLLMLITMLAGISGQAQTDTACSVFSAGGDVVSRYVWRGMALSQSAAIQPTASVALGDFSFGTWGSYTISPEALQEVDLFASYSIGNVTVTINDYFNPIDTTSVGDYFNWKKDSTRHTLEAAVSIDGPEAFPFQLVAGVFFYGDDIGSNGKNLYSTYIELNKTWTSGDYNIKPFVGITPKTGYYSDNGFRVVNVGVCLSREIKVSNNFAVPLNLSFITNPDKENVFLVLGLTF